MRYLRRRAPANVDGLIQHHAVHSRIRGANVAMGGGPSVSVYNDKSDAAVRCRYRRISGRERCKADVERGEALMDLCERHGRLRCGECAYIEELRETIGMLTTHCREVIDLIVPNESEYKCEYRTAWALERLREITGESDDE